MVNTDQVKTEFISLASHQLRTPLTIINWYTEILLSQNHGPLNPKQKEYLDEIYTASKRMENLVNSLLLVSKLEQGIFKSEPVPSNIAALITKLTKDIQPMADRKGIQIHPDLTSGLPLFSVDPKLFYMVIQNLLSNAVQYTTGQGTVNVTLRPVKKSEPVGKSVSPSDGILFTVSDTGIGIPVAEKELVFTKLYRAENGRKLDPQGSGLGLYIVKSAVDLVHGSVWFESRPEGGTVFYVIFPAKT